MSYEEHKLSEDIKLKLKMTEIFGECIDERKQRMLIASNYLELYCQEIAKRFEIDIIDMRNYTFEEMNELLLDGTKADKDLLNKRMLQQRRLLHTALK